jgi:hypothetical protein
LDRRLGGPQSLSGHGVEEKNSQRPEKDQEPHVPREGLTVIIQGSNEWLPRPAEGETFLLIRIFGSFFNKE